MTSTDCQQALKSVHPSRFYFFSWPRLCLLHQSSDRQFTCQHDHGGILQAFSAPSFSPSVPTYFPLPSHVTTFHFRMPLHSTGHDLRIRHSEDITVTWRIFRVYVLSLPACFLKGIQEEINHTKTWKTIFAFKKFE